MRKLFDVVCPTTFLGLPLNHLDDGTWRGSAMGLGVAPVLIAPRGDLANVTRVTAAPEVRFTRADNMGWATSAAITVAPSPRLPAMFNAPGALDFVWDATDPNQWVLNGLPLAMGKDEILHLPAMMVSVVNANEAGTRFAEGDKCALTIRLAIRTDRGSPSIPDQTIVLAAADIKNAMPFLGQAPEEPEVTP